MRTDAEDGVYRITFDRPAARNALTTDAAAAFADAIADADPDDHDVVLVAGEGEAFSAGGDVEAMAEREETPGKAYDRIRETFGRVAEEMLECPVPIVARVDGDAVGAGLSIVALSDIAYAVEGVCLSCAFVRVGLVPDTGGTFLLPEIVGLQAAKRLAFTGEFVSATEAADLDLVTEAVPGGELDARVDETIDRLARRPTRTIGLARRAIHENLGRHWSEALDYEALLQTQAYGSDAHEEGVAAFLEDREPEFE